MVGVKGSGGPVPKRSDQRRRRNAPAKGLTKAETAAPATMRANPKWHPVAKRWFESLAASGQSAFYTSSDWGTAFVLAETVSRELRPQPMVVGETVEFFDVPLKGSTLTAFLRGCTSLLATEGDRRRVALELQSPKAAEGDGGGVAWIDDARSRLRGTS